jgi:hypothetical protein
VDENNFATWPAAIYGRILFECSSVTIIENFNKVHGTNSTLAKTMGKNAKVMLHQKLYAWLFNVTGLKIEVS